MTVVAAPDGSPREFPDDMSMDQITAVMRKQFPPPSSVSSTIDSMHKGFNRASDLGLRALTEAAPTAIGGIPALMLDANDSLVNLGLHGYNAIAPLLGGEQKDYIPTFRHARALADVGDKAASLLGLPEPETKMEKGLVGLGTAGVSALGGAGLAGTMAKGVASAEGAAPSILRELAASPGLQTAGAVGSAGAAMGAREMGLPPAAQIGLGFVGALAPGAGMSGLERAAGGVGGLIAPFRSLPENGGGLLPGATREVIAGKVLNKLATTPGLTPSIMDGAQPLIPGSNPTMAQVSRDPGLIAGEVGIRNALDTSGRISQRLSEQNSARQAALDEITMPSARVPEGGTPERGTLEYAQAKRNRAVTQNQAQAFRGSGIADHDPVLGSINDVLSGPTGAKKDVQDAMAFAYDRLSQERVDLTDPETLYAIRQDLADARNGKYNADKPSLRLAKGELQTVISSLDDAIDSAAPGYRRYLDLYAKRSRPLNQQDAITDLRERGQVAASDPVSGERILSLGRFGTAVRKSLASGALGRGVGNANLSDPQINTLTNIVADLDRGAATTASTMKPPGSDTFRNLSIASLIGRVMGDNFPQTATGKAMQAIAKPLSWMYSVPDETIGHILVDASLDPRLASRLMRAANRHEVESIAAELSRRVGRQEQGAVANTENK